METKKELLLLQIREAIVEKEWIIAQANHDITKYGEWQCNWNEGMSFCQEWLNNKFEELFEILQEEKGK